MVHALREAHRVLRPDGALIDLRPEPEHRRIGLGEGRSWRLVGVTRESLDMDHAADRAVVQVLRAGLFSRGTRARFLVEREMDAMEDFVAWLTDCGQRRMLATHRWLIRRLRRALAARAARIVARGPVRLQLLRKLG